MKTQINIKLEKDILEKLDEKAEKEHRTRTNLIEKIILDYIGLKQYWLWINSGESDIGDDMREKDQGIWDGCDPRTLKGDKVLIYRTSPHKHIKYLAEVLEDAEEDEIWTQKGDKMGYYCRFRILKSFESPLEIKEMRNYESLENWYPLKVSFIRMVFKIEEKFWNILQDILITKNPKSKDLFN